MQFCHFLGVSPCPWPMASGNIESLEVGPHDSAKGGGFWALRKGFHGPSLPSAR